MKKNQTFLVVATLLLALPVVFSACVKDDCTREYTYTLMTPVYKTKAEVRANIKSNPARELRNTGKLYVLGNYIFLNEIDKGIHVIDNTNPAAPRNSWFIDIPGNVDLAVKGNTLYADLYTDLVTIDISNPAAVVVKKVVENMFPHRAYGNGFNANNNQIIVEWNTRDTTVRESCDRQNWAMNFTRGDVLLANSGTVGGGFSTATGAPKGISGSMARFTIMNDRLYTVNMRDLDVFNITNAVDPVHTNRVNVGWNIETVYPFRDKLFVGSQTGMYIFNVSNPDAPYAAGQFQHVRTCDPVIADDNYAYVTLSSGNVCQGFTNELDILELNAIGNPQLVKVYTMNSPKGLSKSGDHLFICDGTAGVKVYNAADVTNLRLVKTITGYNAFDVIAYNNLAMVVAVDGLYQYDYTDINNIRLLSKMTINK
ncbi:MAG: hypothetical protein H7Y42_09910 [Chitinophagaceae bacterium]|nr:hypothetical protein [Chitinophagaceae bacterium]